MSVSTENDPHSTQDVECQASEQHARARVLAPSVTCGAPLLAASYAFRSGDGRLLSDIYEVDKELGGGMSSKVYLARERRTGEPRAVKMMEKPIFDEEFMDDSAEAAEEFSRMFRTEMSILQAVDHPHIVRLYDAFENCRSSVFSMEFCAEGNLLAYLEKATCFAEDTAACSSRQICSALAHLHSLNILHRDVKPGNVLVSGRMTTSKKSECPFLKLADFGVSVFDAGGETSTVGTSEYAAPEVTSGSPCGKPGDMWSFGMIAFVLLSGADAAAIRHSVEHAELPSIENVSTVADDFLRRFLLLVPEERGNASEALAHEWLANELPGVEQSELSQSLARLKSFSKLSRLQRAVMQVVAHSMPAERIADLAARFAIVDTDQDGMISLDELHSFLQRIDPDCQRYTAVFEAMDMDRNLCINYTEFVAACLGHKAYMQREALWRAFCAIDVEETGYISFNNLKELLQGSALQSTFSDIMVRRAFAEMDLDSDGKVTFVEFYKMMQNSGGACAAPKKQGATQSKLAGRVAKRRRLDISAEGAAN